MLFKKPKFKRSGSWTKVRNEFLKLHPHCAVCGIRTMLEVHHCIPVHLDRDLELDPRNLLVLCEGPCNCHFVWGHLMNWRSYNPTVREDVYAFVEKVLKRPYGRRE
jgi:5-methylcytosine-specific restriction protein A